MEILEAYDLAGTPRGAAVTQAFGDGGALVVIQRQLGHADLRITFLYLRAIDNTEIVHAVHERPAPMIPATNGFRFTR